MGNSTDGDGGGTGEGEYRLVEPVKEDLDYAKLLYLQMDVIRKHIDLIMVPNLTQPDETREERIQTVYVAMMHLDSMLWPLLNKKEEIVLARYAKKGTRAPFDITFQIFTDWHRAQLQIMQKRGLLIAKQREMDW